MKRFVKVIFTLLIGVLLLSLMSCSTTSHSTKSIDKEYKESKIKQIHQDKVMNEATNSPIKGEVQPQAKDSKIMNQEVKNPQKQTNTVQKPGQPVKNDKSKETESNVIKAKNTVVNKQSSSAPKSKTTQKTSVAVSAPKDTDQYVTISIMGVKEVGTILKETKVNFCDGDTVLDILLKISEKNNFDVEYSGTGAMAYIEGIDNLYEFDYGPKSGWNYKLNGTAISKSSGSVKVKKNDQIEWVYLEDFSEDK